MKREGDIRECKRILEDDQPDHLHIRRRVIVSGFLDNLKSSVDDFRTVSADISEWERAEIMGTLRNELQKEQAWFKYQIGRIKSFGVTIAGFGASKGTEKSPDYDRASNYLRDIAINSSTGVLVFIDYYGRRPVDNFGWIAKLDIPDNTTIVTDGFTDCDLEESEQFDIGRLDIQQTVDYLTGLKPEISEKEATEIHQVHDGNPVAIEMAAKRGSLRQPLSGDALNQLWEGVYDDAIGSDGYNLLIQSSELIDLNQRTVAAVTQFNRGQVKEILHNLEQKGVVSEKQSGLFTTDAYVKRYASQQLSRKELSDQHQLSFRHHVELWADNYRSRMERLQDFSGEGEDDPQISPPDFDAGMEDLNFFLAVSHLQNINSEVDRETFIHQIQQIDADPAALFTFGMLAQKFFFNDPYDVLQDLSKTLLDINEDIQNELFSGTIGVLFQFDVREFLTQLANGWSGDITTEQFETGNLSQPDEAVESIQGVLNSEMPTDLPHNVKLAIAQLTLLPLVDTRTARQYYDRFGKIANKYGLEEKPFCDWAEELRVLLDELYVDEAQEDEEPQEDPHEEQFETLDREIRDRLQLQEALKHHQSQAQEQFQRNIELIRDHPEDVANQYIKCGDQLERMENTVFAYLWYAVGHHMFSKILLGGSNRAIFGKYKELGGRRQEREKEIPDEEIVIEKERIDTWFSGDT